jgi:hypothetical protein
MKNEHVETIPAGPDNAMTRVSSKCRICGEKSEFEVLTSGHRLAQRGLMVDVAHPNLPLELRRQLTDSICPACQAKE